MAERWHDKTIDEVADKTGCDINSGLSNESARERLERSGKNDIFPIEKKSAAQYLSDFSTNGIALLLALVAIISLFFEEYLLAVFSISLIALSYLVVFAAYYSSRVVLDRAARNSLPSARVIRSGRLTTVRQDEIVVGDLIQLSAGDIVPCDARLVKDNSLYILETGITGGVGSIAKKSDFIEYRNVPPHLCHNMAWASTIVTKGSGLAIACEVGRRTLVCRLGKNRPAAEYHKLSIFDTLRRIGGKMSLFYIAAAFIISFLGLLPAFGLNDSLMTLLVALSLGVAGLSEFLVLFGYITVACGLFESLSKRKQNKSGALIKNADRLDTIKKVDTIIVPPEAIYSKRRMSLEKAYVSGRLYDVSERGFADTCTRLLKYAVVTTGLYGQNKVGASTDEGGDFYTFEEDAILRYAFECGIYNSSLESEYPLIEFKRKSDVNEFDTALVRFNGDNTVVIRGEADEIISRCTHYYENGRVLRLDPVEKSKIEVAAVQLMRQAYRVIAVASKTSRYNSLAKLSDSQNQLIFDGFIALIEPILPSVSQTVARCRAAGVKIMMFSDEKGEKNFQIARAIGMLSSRKDVISGEQMRAVIDADPENAASVISRYTMFEGMSVSDKELAIRKLRESGRTVAFLGNKLRELPLLKVADVGMTECLSLTGEDSEKPEIDGCEALRFVADAVVTMVDADSRGGLNSAVEAVKIAKNINNNIYRTLKYLISMQSVRLVMVIWFLASGTMLLSPTAILISGLVLDFSAAMIMAFKRPSPRILAEEDRDISEKSMLKTGRHCSEKGLVCGVVAIILTYISVLLSLVAKEALPACAFLTLVTLSASVMMQTLLEGRPAKSELRIGRIQLLYLAALSVFAVCCIVFKGMTCAITGASAVSALTLLPAIAICVLAPLISGAFVKFTKSEKTKKNIEKIKKNIKNKITNEN